MNICFVMHLRNELDFWKVHGIVNTSCVLQSELEARSINDSMNLPKIEFIACIYILL